MSYSNTNYGVNVNVWSGKLISAPYDVIEAAIQHALAGAPTPLVTPYCATPMRMIDDPEYGDAYYRLWKLFVAEFANADKLDLNEYGFSTWTSVHPLINNLALMVNKLHWYHMRSIVEDIERDVRIQELQRGSPYSPADRIELIKARAVQISKAARSRDIENEQYDAMSARIAQNNADGDAIQQQIDHLNAGGEGTGSGLIETAANFNNKHPFVTGLIATSLFYKLKDALFNK